MSLKLLLILEYGGVYNVEGGYLRLLKILKVETSPMNKQMQENRMNLIIMLLILHVLLKKKRD